MDKIEGLLLGGIFVGTTCHLIKTGNEQIDSVIGTASALTAVGCFVGLVTYYGAGLVRHIANKERDYQTSREIYGPDTSQIRERDAGKRERSREHRV
jgi:hypothetical protein